ncbi:MAG: ribonuclease HII [Candidatus Anstonellales archaeon]
MIGGIDEAGRGCVLGPMVICLTVIDPLNEFKLKEIGVRDSKKLSPRRREALFYVVRKLCKTSWVIISASELNRLMENYNLNEIEAQKVAYLLQKASILPPVVYIDAPDNPPANFARRIKKYLKKQINLFCENKAEEAHPIVGAASIVAKVVRDREIENIKEQTHLDFGSGYTSDPITINFLSKNIKNPAIIPYIRTKWKTVSDISQKKLFDF